MAEAFKRPRLRLFNVKYSPNLGDGLLSECLEQALVDLGAAPGTHSIDLAARTRFSPGGRARALQLRFLDTLPTPLRQQAVRVPLAMQARRRWRPHYRTSLSQADAVVIGGGNLLTDVDLNFPTKLSLVIEEAANQRLPVFVYGCGASSHWSLRGRELLQAAIGHGNLRGVFLRDEHSRDAWDALFGDRFGVPSRVARDPGLLASQRYELTRCPVPESRLMIGLNITSQLALRYHATNVSSRDWMDRWYLALAAEILAAGFGITAFTNGSPEDRAYLNRLRPAFAALAGPRTIEFPEIETPEELTRLIATFHGLVAFRMHAVIAAYSCAVPFLALAWDPKLDAFVDSVNCGDWLCRPAETAPQAAAQQLFSAIRTGIRQAERDRTLAQARQGVADLFEAIREALT